MLGNIKEDDCCRKKFKDYISKNEDFFNNKLIKEFLKVKENEVILMDTICNPSSNNMELLDITFRNFYFNIRFTSYISSALYFNAINFDKRYRKIKNRHPLTVDKPIGDTEDGTFKEHICDKKAEIKLDDLVQSDNIIDYIEDPILYEALNTLSDRQVQILNLAYINGLSDTEIGMALNKSQQTVSKTHQKALDNIYSYLKRKE